MYADGSYGGANPYVSTPPKPYADPTIPAQAYSEQVYSDPATNEQVGYAGPDNNIPVLGKTILGTTGREPL